MRDCSRSRDEWPLDGERKDHQATFCPTVTWKDTFAPALPSISIRLSTLNLETAVEPPAGSCRFGYHVIGC